MQEFDIPGSETPHYTEARQILSGTLNLSGSEIPFYQAMLPLKAVVDELDLVENLPSDLRANWRLEELFQREIDWERVREDLVKGYLKRPNKLKFFSTLTVALLPLGDDGLLANEYGDAAALPTPLPWSQSAPWDVRQIGNVELVTNKAGSGALRWDPNKIFAATIDGQHRLAALKTFVNEGHLSSKSLESKVSVMFLILDPRAGFILAPGQVGDDENPILTVVREIFIDLNMHSKTVARARQILLSDQDIEARCLREVISTRVGVREDGRLPLGLIHWQHNESAKFNISEKTAPFITTVELLYAVIKDLLDLSRPKDPLDPDQIRRFVNSIDSSLSLDAHIKSNSAKYSLKPLMSYVEEHHLKKDFESSFPNPPSPYIRAIADSFSVTWRPLILSVLTRFAPYARFIKEVDERGGIEGDIAHYLVQPIGAQKLQREEWGEDAPTRVDVPLGELHKMKSEDWAFYAVFQKAIFRATKVAYQQYSAVPGYTTKKFDDAWIDFLNEMESRGLFKVKVKKGDVPVWAGVGLTPVGHTITWSESAVQRIASLIVIWWYYYTYELSSASTYLKKLASAQGAEKFPGGKSMLTSLKRGIEGLQKGINPDASDSKITSKAADRMKELVVLARSSAASAIKDAEIEGLSDEVGPDPAMQTEDTDQSETLILESEA